MIKKVLESDSNSWGQLIARIALGIVLFAHGAQKMMGWFGGYGFSATLNALTTQMQLPLIIAFLVIVVEFFGAIFLLIGLASRAWALAIIFLFVGIIFTAQIEHGFFMNWFGVQKGEGYEYSLLAIGLALITFVNGSGRWALDNTIFKHLNK